MENPTGTRAVSAIPTPKPDELWSAHEGTWRQPEQVISHWQDAESVDKRLLECKVEGQWWETLAKLGITIIVGREYEHLAVSMSADEEPRVSFLPLPHPSGIAVSPDEESVFIASTRNPNQIFEFKPSQGLLSRKDRACAAPDGAPLLPVKSQFIAGCFYLHDLAFIGDSLYGNAVGRNAIVRFDGSNEIDPIWWPKCIERDGDKPDFEQNYIQLNSIAAGKTIEESFFSASSDEVAALRPGHPDYPVDRRGVIFSGQTRQPICRGLTRPHSARQHNGRLWVDNSGYGEFGYVEGEQFVPVRKLDGWTRGLCMVGNVAFIGVSRVIPKFKQYAPGLDVDKSSCGVVALNLRTGEVLGSVTWPWGNQIFAIESLSSKKSKGFPFVVNDQNDLTGLFYAFEVGDR